jgi:hypothetical protein
MLSVRGVYVLGPLHLWGRRGTSCPLNLLIGCDRIDLNITCSTAELPVESTLLPPEQPAAKDERVDFALGKEFPLGKKRTLLGQEAR